MEKQLAKLTREELWAIMVLLEALSLFARHTLKDDKRRFLP